MSPELFVNVSTFDIPNFDPLLSDVHKPVTFSLSCTGMSLNQENFESQNEDDTNNTGNQYVEKPVWNTKNRQDFVDAFDHGAIDIILGKLNQISANPVNDLNIDDIISDISDIFINAAKSVDMIKKINTSNTRNDIKKNTQKTWFDTDCKEERKSFCVARSNCRRCISNIEIGGLSYNLCE